MSAFDTVQTLTDTQEMEQDDDLDWYMDQVYGDIASAHRERPHHDRKSFFCHFAGDPQCLALGHEPGEDGDWSGEGDHRAGWDGDLICPDTRYGEACSQCEGECDFYGIDLFGTREDLWKLVRA